MLKPKPSLQEVVTLAEQRTKSKPIDKFKSKTKSIKTPEEEIKDITPKKEKPQYISFHHIPNKILTGENISEFLFKLIDLFDKNNKIQIQMSLVKVSLSNFNFKVDVDDTFEVESFRDDILEVIAVIPKSQVFALTAEIKEIEGLVLGQDNKDKKEDKLEVKPEVKTEDKTDKHIDIIKDVTEKLLNN
jgi:hypothetical protein